MKKKLEKMRAILLERVKSQPRDAESWRGSGNGIISSETLT